MLGKLVAAGVTTVRMDISWGMLQPNPPSSANGGYDLQIASADWGVSRIDRRISELESRGMKAVVMVYIPPTWASISGHIEKSGEVKPAAYSDYGRVLGWAARRWPRVTWEMWNEPDLADFWASGDPVTYANMIKTAYPIAKALAPNSTFILGAPTYIGMAPNVRWFERMYAVPGFQGNYDAVAIHPYMGPSDAAPYAAASPWAFRGIPALIDLLKRHGDGNKKVYATEFGWSTHSNKGPEKLWNRGVTEAQQAEYILAAYAEMAKFPQIAAAYVYTERDTAVGDPQQDGYGVMRRDLSLKPSYYAVKCAASGNCGPGGSPGSSGSSAKKAQKIRGSVISKLRTHKGAALPKRTTRKRVVKWASLTPKRCKVRRGKVIAGGKAGTCQLRATAATTTKLAGLNRIYRIRVTK